MQLINELTHCPRCGSNGFALHWPNGLLCKICDFSLFINASVAVCGIVRDAQNRVLVIRRAREPGKGKLALPGGFVDAGESGEDAVIRELHEETGLVVTSTQYFASFPNEYTYRGVTIPTLDLFYWCEVENYDLTVDAEEIAEYIWTPLSELTPEEAAFPSNYAAMEKLKALAKSL